MQCSMTLEPPNPNVCQASRLFFCGFPRAPELTHRGRLYFDRRKISLSRVFAGQDIGIREVSDNIWHASSTGASFYGIRSLDDSATDTAGYSAAIN